MILSSSRDKSLIVWKLTRDSMDSSSGGSYGIPQKRLHGHGHFVSDVVLSSDGHFALSGSWDKTLRLWDLSTGNTTRRFESHTKDVMSVAFSADNRQIVSGSRDKSIKLWNTLAQCKYTIQEEGHSDWVSCVRFSPNNQNPIIVSCGWDKYVKVGLPCIAYVLNSCLKLRSKYISTIQIMKPIYITIKTPSNYLISDFGEFVHLLLFGLQLLFGGIQLRFEFEKCRRFGDVKGGCRQPLLRLRRFDAAHVTACVATNSILF